MKTQCSLDYVTARMFESNITAHRLRLIRRPQPAAAPAVPSAPSTLPGGLPGQHNAPHQLPLLPPSPAALAEPPAHMHNCHKCLQRMLQINSISNVWHTVYRPPIISPGILNNFNYFLSLLKGDKYQIS